MVEYFELSFLLFRLTNYHSYQSKGCINFLTTTLTTFNLYNFIRDLNLTKQLKIFFIKKLSQVVTRIGEESIFLQCNKLCNNFIFTICFLTNSLRSLNLDVNTKNQNRFFYKSKTDSVFIWTSIIFFQNKVATERRTWAKRIERIVHPIINIK